MIFWTRYLINVEINALVNSKDSSNDKEIDPGEENCVNYGNKMKHHHRKLVFKVGISYLEIKKTFYLHKMWWKMTQWNSV